MISGRARRARRLLKALRGEVSAHRALYGTRPLKRKRGSDKEPARRKARRKAAKQARKRNR